jgi:hypothetical protein
MKLGLVVGFTTGYVLGAKAGRERYEQIMSVYRRVKSSPAFQTASGKVGAAVGLSLERGKVIALDRLKKASGVGRSSLATGSRLEL